MKRSRFSDEQIIGILREHEAVLSAADLCRKHGISDATFYKWRAEYGGMDISGAKRLKTLQDENSRLKKLLAESMLDVSTLARVARKKLLTPKARRSAVHWAIQEKHSSRRRACVLVGMSPKTYRHVSIRPDDDAIRKRLRALDRDDFGLNQSKIMTAIYFNSLERDFSGKPRTLFRIPL